LQNLQDVFFLQTNGSGVLSFSSPSSDFVLLATTDASASATVSFDGYFTSTYKNYKLIFSNIVPSSNAAYLYIRYRRSNADVTTSNYRYVNGYFYLDTAGNALYGTQGTSAQTYVDVTNLDTFSTASHGGISGEMTIHNPLSTTHYKWSRWSACQNNSDATSWKIIDGTMLLRDATTAISGFTFYFNSGNITTGNFKLYGIK
jgi:hypothetical protein